MLVVAARTRHECLSRFGANATILLPGRVPRVLDSLSDYKVRTNPYGAFLLHMQKSSHTYGWFLEDDVYYHGDLSAFFDKFHNNTADLLAFAVRERHDFYTYRTCSLLQQGQATPCKMTFHVSRISKRFAAYTIARYKTGMRCHHEVVLPTLCRQTPWCSMQALPLSSAGVLHAPGGTRPNRCCRLSSYTLKRGQFFHPAKCRATHDHEPTTMATKTSLDFCRS